MRGTQAPSVAASCSSSARALSMRSAHSTIPTCVRRASVSASSTAAVTAHDPRRLRRVGTGVADGGPELEHRDAGQDRGPTDELLGAESLTVDVARDAGEHRLRQEDNAARVAGIRRWPHSCSGSAIAGARNAGEHDREDRERAERTDALPGRRRDRQQRTTPICIAANCNGRSRFAYTPMYTMCQHEQHRAREREHLARPRCTSAPVSR